MFEFSKFFDQCLPSYFLSLIENQIDNGNLFSLKNGNNIFSIVNKLLEESNRCLRDDSLQYLINQTITNHFSLQTTTYMNHKCDEQIKCNIKTIPHLIIHKFQNEQVKILLYQVMICFLQAKYALNGKLPNLEMSNKLIETIRSFYFNLRVHYNFSTIQYTLNEFMDYAIELLLNTSQITIHYKRFLQQIIKKCDLNQNISAKILNKINQTSIKLMPIQPLNKLIQSQNVKVNQSSYPSLPKNPRHFNQQQVFRSKKPKKNQSRQINMVIYNQSTQIHTPVKNKKQIKIENTGSITSKKRLKNDNKQITPSKQTHQKYKKKYSPNHQLKTTRFKSYDHANQTLRSPLKRILQKIRLQKPKPIPQRTIYLRKKNFFVPKKIDKTFLEYYDNKDRTTVVGTMTDIFDSDRKPSQKKSKFLYDLKDLDVLVDETPKLKKIKKSETGSFDISGNFMFKQ